jgi:hemoglobin-like flavoprotein
MLLSITQAENIKSTFALLAPRGDELAERFFEALFAKQPGLRRVVPTDHWMRARDLMAGLGMLVKNVHRLEAVEHVLHDVGARAQRAGVLPQQYGVARQVMLETMKGMLGESWDEEVEGDWTQLLNAATSVVLVGGGRVRAKAA